MYIIFCRVRTVTNLLARVLKKDAVIHGYYVPAGVSQLKLANNYSILLTCTRDFVFLNLHGCKARTNI